MRLDSLSSVVLFFTRKIVLFITVWAVWILGIASAFANDLFISNDLDGTIFDTIHDLQQVRNLDDVIKISDGMHQPVYGAAAYLQSVLDIPGVKVAFTSGGNEVRNKEGLGQIIMLDGRSMLEHNPIILSEGDLTPYATGPGTENLRYRDRYKKDLRKVSGGDLSNLLHIDDIIAFILPGQERNGIDIGPAYDFISDFGQYAKLNGFPDGKKLDRPPPSRKAWAYDTQRLIYARGLIEESIQIVRKKGGMTLPQAATFLQQYADPRHLLEVGRRVMGKYELNHSRFVRKASCPRVLDQLLRQASP
jgi:hypothetical protein